MRNGMTAKREFKQVKAFFEKEGNTTYKGYTLSWTLCLEFDEDYEQAMECCIQWKDKDKGGELILGALFKDSWCYEAGQWVGGVDQSPVDTPNGAEDVLKYIFEYIDCHEKRM